LIVLPQNQGKGPALMRGFSAARGTYVSFIDADGDIDPAHLVGYVDRIREGGDMVYACKRHEHSISASSSLRKLISIGFSTYTSMLFRLGVADTQTGCKMMRRELMADVLPHMHERRFAFDLELFVVAKRRGHDDLRPAPVELGERLAGSTVTSKAVLRTLKDSLTIWKRLYLHGLYPASTEFVPASLSDDLGHLQAVA
jgi:glycosyltransferase involved in cell wall biosynthesis